MAGDYRNGKLILDRINWRKWMLSGCEKVTKKRRRKMPYSINSRVSKLWCEQGKCKICLFYLNVGSIIRAYTHVSENHMRLHIAVAYIFS